MASFLLGYPSLTVHDYTFNWPGERGIEFGLYFADDWRVTRKLTLNLGLRWDYYSPFSEVANRWANFNVRTRKSTSPARMAWTSMPASSRITRTSGLALDSPISFWRIPYSRRLWDLLQSRRAMRAAACGCSGSFRSDRLSVLLPAISM